MTKNNFPKVSIIFSNFNGGIEPIECLESIRKLTYPQEKIEVIVVDNGSTDGSREQIEKEFPKVKLIKLKKEIGLSASINLGIKRSRGSYILVGNDDIVFEKNSITKMVEYLENHQDIGVLGGKVFYKDRPKTLTDFVSGFNFYLGSIQKPKKKSDILWLQSCSVMIPKRVFDDIGFFDEGFYPLYFDDFDFCLRAKRAGYRLAHNPEAIFWHGYGKTTKKFQSSKFYFWWQKNKIRFMFKNATPLQITTALVSQFLASIVKSLTTRQNLLFPLVKALGVNLIQLPQTIRLRKNQTSQYAKKPK